MSKVYQQFMEGRPYDHNADFTKGLKRFSNCVLNIMLKELTANIPPDPIRVKIYSTALFQFVKRGLKDKESSAFKYIIGQ